MTRAQKSGYQEKDLDQCVTCFKLALNLDPNFVPGLLGLAAVYAEKGDYKSALILYQKALCINPDFSPDLRIPIGMCFHNLDMSEEARKAFNRALERDPDNVYAIMFLSLIDVNSSKTEKSKNQRKILLKEANAKVLKAFQMDPRNPLCTLQMSERFFEKDLHKAKVMAQSSLVNSKSAKAKKDAYMMLGRIAHSQGDLKVAMENYKAAIKLCPDSLMVHFPLAQLYLSQDKPEEAIQCLEKVLAKHPTDYDSLKLLFSVYTNKPALHEKAEVVFESLKKIVGDSEKELKVRDPELIADIAAYLEKSNVQQARKKYHQLLNMMEEENIPVPPELLNNVAVLYHMEADGISSYFDPSFRMNYRVGVDSTDHAHESNVMNAAETIYQRALVSVTLPDYVQNEDPWKVNALQTSIRYNVARLFETRGELDKAEAHLKEILKIHPAYDDCMLRLGFIEESRKNYEKALDYYSDALAVDPQNSLAWYMIGNHFMQVKQYRPARRAFEKVLENNKHDSYALTSAGNLNLIFARGDPKPENRALHFRRAVEFFCKALFVDPLNVHAAAGIGIAYAESGNLLEAANVLNQVFSINKGSGIRSRRSSPGYACCSCAFREQAISSCHNTLRIHSQEKRIQKR
jgi:RNA polymerase-associated protein CTR9